MFIEHLLKNAVQFLDDFLLVLARESRPRLRGQGFRAARLVLLHERKKLLHGSPGECGARRVLSEERQAGDAARKPQHDAVAVAHQADVHRGCDCQAARPDSNTRS